MINKSTIYLSFGRVPGKMLMWLFDIFEGGKKIEELRDWLAPVTLTKDYSYRSFEIPKRNGGKRLIESPNENLKKVQRQVYWRILKELKKHPACVGFMPGLSIVEAAKPHVGRLVVINLDLKDFFHSIAEKRVSKFFRGLGWGRTATRELTKICCYRGRLPQGAPTSPMLSNVINYQMDIRIDSLVKKYGGSYSRYADDITLSFNEFKDEQKAVLRSISAILSAYGLNIQKKKKIRIQRQHQRQTVVGLVVNKKINLPREWRRKLRAMKHQGKLSDKELRGYEGLNLMIEKRR